MAFHVPELSRLTEGPSHMVSDSRYGNNGAFQLESPNPGWRLMIIASDEPLEGSLPWEHVSVQAYRDSPAQVRIPTWKEMCFVKDVFWDAEDVVMQLHPKRSEYVNHHPAVLHLWRPVGVDIPTPPSSMIGPKLTPPWKPNVPKIRRRV